MSEDKPKKEYKKKPKRNAAGQFKKGVSGNPTGRPKAEKLTGKDKEEIRQLIESRDIEKILGFLCERATHVNDVFKFVKEFAPYLAPKLQTINSINKTDNKITIQWQQELIKKVEDIDAEYEKLASKPDDDNLHLQQFEPEGALQDGD